MAWFWLIVPIVQAAWVLSKGGKRLVGPHMLLAAVSELLFSCTFNCWYYLKETRNISQPLFTLIYSWQSVVVSLSFYLAL